MDVVKFEIQTTQTNSEHVVATVLNQITIVLFI